MDVAPPDASSNRPPGARELLPLLPIVLAVSWFVRGFVLYPWVTTRTAVVIAVASAGLIGLPALFWALDHGHRRFATLLALGTAVGLMPLFIIMMSGVVGVTARTGVDNIMLLLEKGVPIPGLGVMPWRTFLRGELFAAATGALSAAVYWIVLMAPTKFDRRRHPQAP
jgi:hypothetical protein